MHPVFGVKLVMEISVATSFVPSIMCIQVKLLPTSHSITALLITVSSLTSHVCSMTALQSLITDAAKSQAKIIN